MEHTVQAAKFAYANMDKVQYNRYHHRADYRVIACSTAGKDMLCHRKQVGLEEIQI